MNIKRSKESKSALALEILAEKLFSDPDEETWKCTQLNFERRDSTRKLEKVQARILARKPKLKYTVAAKSSQTAFDPRIKENDMKLPRRNFLKSGALTALFAGVALSSARSAFSQDPGRGRRQAGTNDVDIPRRAQKDPLFSFNHKTFEPYIGDIFQAPNARGENVSLTLVAVDVYKLNPKTRNAALILERSDSFSLSFKAEEPLPKFTSIHKMSHPALGSFDLFMTPHQADDGTMTYEAVFNHLR